MPMPKSKPVKTSAAPWLLRGSLIVLRRRCGKPACHCAKGLPHATPALSFSQRGKTRILTLRPAQLAAVRAALRRYIQSTAVQVLEQYGERWSIEDTFKNTKQHLRGQDPQVWKDPGPGRAAAFSFWLYSLVWFWHLTANQRKPAWIAPPWYPAKSRPSFADALATLRRARWQQSIFSQSDAESDLHKNMARLIDVLSCAA